MNFASDNCAPVHPRIMAALIEANDGAAASYGRDDLTRRAEAALRDRFEAPDAAVFLLGTGTGANALALAQMIPPLAGFSAIRARISRPANWVPPALWRAAR